METITCIIVDDEKDGRERLKKLLSHFAEVKILATEAEPEAGIEQVCTLKPDVVFLAIEMPRMSGFDVIDAVKSRNVTTQFIIVTAFSHYAIRAIKSGAFDYLVKPCDFDELKMALTRFRSGKILGHPMLRSLTDREKEVLTLIVHGAKSKEIAAKLFISKTTVDTHRKSIIEKTGVRSVSEFIIQVLNK